ncbi:MAG: hypothetical protein EBV41_03730 [Actinobacteria bacterium]|nr:hypothetical protein [Actinomycetota bacterium]
MVYAVASIGCTLGLLTTAVLGSFTRHGVVSGVASVAMYGLGMGVFVTALTVTLAFAKSGLLRASRSVMKVLDRVSSALVIATGVYLTWYWYAAITERLQPGGIVSWVGSMQSALVSAMLNVGPLSLLLCLLLIIVLATQTSRLRVTASLHSLRSDLLIGVLLMASVAIMLVISRQLIVVTDFKMYMLGFERLRDARQLLPGSIGDFSRSLGISEYPGSLLFNIPWLLATSVPANYAVAIYGVATSAALYACVIVLGIAVGVPPIVRQSAGLLLPFVVFIPGPLLWNSVARYDPAFTWMISVTALATIPICILPRISVRTTGIVGFFGGCFVFLSNIQFLATTGLVVASILGLTFSTCRRMYALRNYFVFIASLSLPALIASPVFLGAYLLSVWRIPDIAVAENIDLGLNAARILNFLLPMPRLGSALTSESSTSFLLRGIGLLIMMIAIWIIRRNGYPRLALLSIHSLWLLLAYTLIYIFGIGVLDMELGLDPTYVQVFAYPIWVLLLVTAFLILPLRMFRQFSVVTAALPAILIVLWTAQWIVRNFDDRTMRAEYPIILSSTTRELMNRHGETSVGRNLDRTIIFQERFPPERQVDGYRIRRSDDFSETFLMELSAIRVPVLNAYSHLISPLTFELTNEAFGDGRPSWRQFSLYDRPNFKRFADFGIRFVLSEFPINDSQLQLISQEPFVAHGLYPTESFAYLYELIPVSPPPDDGLSIYIDKSVLKVQGKFDKPIERTIPVEFSNCLRVHNSNPTASVTMSRGAEGMLLLRLSGEIDAEIEYRNSIFQFANCRVRDFFDYQKLVDES